MILSAGRRNLPSCIGSSIFLTNLLYLVWSSSFFASSEGFLPSLPSKGIFTSGFLACVRRSFNSFAPGSLILQGNGSGCLGMSDSVRDAFNLLGLRWNLRGLGSGSSSELSDEEQLFSDDDTLEADTESSSEELSMPSSFRPWKINDFCY